MVDCILRTILTSNFGPRSVVRQILWMSPSWVSFLLYMVAVRLTPVKSFLPASMMVTSSRAPCSPMWTMTFNQPNNDNGMQGANDLAATVFLAEAAMLCNASPDEIINKLACKRRINMRAIARDVPTTQTRYNVADFEELGDDGSSRLRRVIAVRGSTSIRNLQDSTDSLFEYDELLHMNIHRGFRRVMYSILDDFPDFVLDKHAVEDRNDVNMELYEVERREIAYSLCGHSLGGVISCLLAAALQKRYNVHIESVAVFGMPMFTDAAGAAKLANVPIERIQHMLDPIGVGPTVTNIDLVHVQAKREIFLSLSDSKTDPMSGKGVDDRNRSPENGFFAPKIPFSDFDVFQYFAEYDRKGRRVENTDISDHSVLVGRDSIRNTLSSLIDPEEGILANLPRFHLRYHSMSKYLEVLKQRQTKQELLAR